MSTRKHIMWTSLPAKSGWTLERMVNALNQIVAMEVGTPIFHETYVEHVQAERSQGATDAMVPVRVTFEVGDLTDDH